MLCPFCKSKNTKVLDKRDNYDMPVSRRRRECESCKKRFTTYERIENIDLEVIKKSGRIEPFDRNKLRAGIVRAVRKNVTEEQIDDIVEKIELDLSSSNTKSIKTSKIGELVLNSLRNIDTLSYLRFASVYKDLKNLDDFEKEIKYLRSQTNDK